MNSYQLSPYVTFVESQLVPGFNRYAIAHRLTGEILELTPEVLSLLQHLKPGQVSLSDEQIQHLGERSWLHQLIKKEFLIPQTYDALRLVVDQLAARPIQNPALTFKDSDRRLVLVRTSMAEQVYARKKGEFPEIIEEELPATAQSILQLADGAKTLAEIFHCLKPDTANNVLEDSDFRAAIEVLTSQERQLVKFTRQQEDLADPYKPVNTVPRDLLQANRWKQLNPTEENADVDFHLRGIEDASWEFDQIESTVNHALRFPDQMLDGLDYGSRFCVSTLKPEVMPSLRHKKHLEVLEVGGGTGTFARSFIEQSQVLASANEEMPQLNYHILDLAPVLIENQKQVLSDLLPEEKHFHQDATKFDLPNHRFDLIISNEVIADFPVATVQSMAGPNGQNEWTGEGAAYLGKYQLTTAGAPPSFRVNVGAMMLIERCWYHLNPGGTFVLSEYGSASSYPVQSFHLNHEEFSIHFGHLIECATQVGFNCRLLSLKEFLALDDEVSVFGGREEHILCLNHVLQQHGKAFPYAIVSEAEFVKRFGKVAEAAELAGHSFLPLKKGFYFGPRIEQFMVLILNKPG